MDDLERHGRVGAHVCGDQVELVPGR